MDLPYAERPGQRDLMRIAEAIQGTGRHAVVEAATGTGKTIAALVASLRTARQDGRRIVYLTRTNSQQSQVVREHRALVKAGMDPGLLVPFMGRRQYCPLLRDDDRFREGSAEELGRLCRDAKRKAVQEKELGTPIKGACPYYLRLLEDGPGPVEALLRSGGQDAASLATAVTAAGSCPYEALKLLLPRAEVVVAPYIFFLDPRLRNTFLTWLGTGPDDVHVVVDEAHNLAEAAREHHSPRLTLNVLTRAQREAEEYKDPALAGSLLSSSLLYALVASLGDLVQEYVIGDTDGRVPPGALEEALMQRLRVPSPILVRAARDLETWGEVVREDRRSKGRLPRSHLGTVGAFLSFWMAQEDAPYAHLVTAGDNPAIEACLLEPAAVLAWLHDCASTLHISGTLAPTQEHVDRCGLPADTVHACLASPFRADQLRLYAVEGLHRRWREHQEDPTHAARQQAAARELLAALPGKTGLFFPSHSMLRDYQEEGWLHGLGRPMYQEEPAMGTPDLARLVQAFKADPDPQAILLGVLGGRLTEGIDFPGDCLQNLLLFGIPYPKPTARLQALVDHADRCHDGKGWTYQVHNPVGRTLRQAIGRLVRGPDDHGVAVILDERAARFDSHLPGLTMVAEVGQVAPTGQVPEHRKEFVTADEYGPGGSAGTKRT